MNDGPDNLVLIDLSRLDEKLDRLLGEVIDLKTRVGFLEQRVAGLHGPYASPTSRLDRVDTRLDRIERRLDLQDA